MSIAVNGQSQVPPGFRFHPTEEELLKYYLKKKVAGQEIDLGVIRDIDLNKLEPWDIQKMCSIGSTATPQNEWYFFSHKDKKYPTGTRTNRATVAGFWKATGRDKVIYVGHSRIGMRKTLVFYMGRAPHGLKSDWIMHEYRLDVEDNQQGTPLTKESGMVGDPMAQEEGWVVCRVFKKKNYFHKAMGSKKCISSLTTHDAGIDEMLQYMEKPCKQEGNPNPNRSMTDMAEDTSLMDELNDNSMAELPALESPRESRSPPVRMMPRVTKDWAAVDRLIASHLNCQTSWVDVPNYEFCTTKSSNNKMGIGTIFFEDNSPCNDMDLWHFPQNAIYP